jgi:hypothetical protein
MHKFVVLLPDTHENRIRVSVMSVVKRQNISDFQIIFGFQIAQRGEHGREN